MTFLDGVYLVFGIYYVLDGLLGYVQTRNWLFLSELLAAWLLAVSPIGKAHSLLYISFLALGVMSLIPIAYALYAVFRGGERYTIVKEFAAIRRQRRTTSERYTFRYRPYAEIPLQDPPKPVPRAGTRVNAGKH